MTEPIDNPVWARCASGDYSVIGFAEAVGGKTYCFKTLNMFCAGVEGRLIGCNEIDILSLEIHEEDVKMMIDMALQMADREWFEELSRVLLQY